MAKYVSMPFAAAAAAAGIYFLDKNHYQPKVSAPLHLYKHQHSESNSRISLISVLLLTF